MIALRRQLALSRGAAAPASERRDDRFSLVVDLGREPIGPLWLRGAATLALLCSAAILLAPGLEPLAARETAPAGDLRMMAFAPIRETGDAAPPAPTFAPTKPEIATDGTVLRVRGSVSDGLYWSLREAGVSPDTAAAYLRAVASRIDVGADVAPFDRFDLIFEKDRPGAPLVYAALHRSQGDDVRLLRWAANGKTDWFDAAGEQRRSDQMMAPVAGRVTSRFGRRVHPIFRYSRMHSGIDFGARWGSPIVAAADGIVIAAGSAGGYGQQVRIAHEGGMVTSYSHMSRIAAAPGSQVRQGEVIGQVGSTGVSTGPHLHFEVRMAGRAIDPLTARLQSRPVMDKAVRTAFDRRLKQLMAIGGKSAQATAVPKAQPGPIEG